MCKHTGIKLLLWGVLPCFFEHAQAHRHQATYCSGVSLHFFQHCTSTQASSYLLLWVSSSMHKHTHNKLLLWREFVLLPACTSTRASSYYSGVSLHFFQHAQAHRHQWREFVFLPACASTQASSYCSGVSLHFFQHAQAHWHQATYCSGVSLHFFQHAQAHRHRATALACFCLPLSMNKHTHNKLLLWSVRRLGFF